MVDSMLGKLIDCSPVVESEPVGFSAETNFYNQVLLVETELSPKEVLTHLLEIEKTLGRERTGTTYSSRSIDIDILFFENIQINDDKLCIPHPRMHLRKFVLQPLAILSPEFIHPVLKVPIVELLHQLNDKNELKIVADKNQFLKLLNSVNLG
jgi:2-amino-4-hydroxy-6-hydroxymethyldihydropteridine diphosphokinase